MTTVLARCDRLINWNAKKIGNEPEDFRQNLQREIASKDSDIRKCKD